MNPQAIPEDSITARILNGGVLYPCQAMFFGTKPAVFNKLYADSAWDTMTDTQRAVWDGLLQVVRRIDESAPLRYLSEVEVTDLLSHDVHRYLGASEKVHSRRWLHWQRQRIVRLETELAKYPQPPPISPVLRKALQSQ